jgi:hypothetical protein
VAALLVPLEAEAEKERAAVQGLLDERDALRGEVASVRAALAA